MQTVTNQVITEVIANTGFHGLRRLLGVTLIYSQHGALACLLLLGLLKLKMERVKMSNEKMREEFEAWAVNYGVDDYESAWQAWKASRAALCVKLPKTTEHETMDNLVNIKHVKQALDFAGVRHK